MRPRIQSFTHQHETTQARLGRRRPLEDMRGRESTKAAHVLPRIRALGRQSRARLRAARAAHDKSLRRFRDPEFSVSVCHCRRRAARAHTSSRCRCSTLDADGPTSRARRDGTGGQEGQSDGWTDAIRGTDGADVQGASLDLSRAADPTQHTTVLPPMGGLNPKNAVSQYLKSDAQLWPARRVPEAEWDRQRAEKRRRLLPTDEATGEVVEPANRSSLDVRAGPRRSR